MELTACGLRVRLRLRTLAYGGRTGRRRCSTLSWWDRYVPILAVLVPPWRPARLLNLCVCLLPWLVASYVLDCCHFWRGRSPVRWAGYERGSDRQRQRALHLTEQVINLPSYAPRFFAAWFGAWTFLKDARGGDDPSLIDRSIRCMHLLWWLISPFFFFRSSFFFFFLFPMDPLILWDLFVIN
jgi:hypothetical protein